MLSTVLTTSTRGVVIGIENRTQNVNKQPTQITVPFSGFQYGRRRGFLPRPTTVCGSGSRSAAQGVRYAQAAVTPALAPPFPCATTLPAGACATRRPRDVPETELWTRRSSFAKAQATTACFMQSGTLYALRVLLDARCTVAGYREPILLSSVTVMCDGRGPSPSPLSHHSHESRPAPRRGRWR